jgi:hypothetical protein
LEEPENLRSGQFLSGGEAWTAFREGRIDAARFGVHGTANWGPAEIRGNAVKDLAALNKAVRSHRLPSKRSDKSRLQ